MPAPAPERKHNARSYAWIVPPVAVLAAVAIGWTAFWYFTSRRSAAAFAEWMSNEAQAGRIWSCAGQKIGGFPFSVEISCAIAVFQGEVLGSKMTAALGALRATAPLLRPGNVLVKLEPPLKVRAGSGAVDATVHWDGLYLETDYEAGALERLSLVGRELRLDGIVGGRDAGQNTAESISGTFSPSQARQDHAYDARITLIQGNIPALTGLLDTKAPVMVQLDSTISQVNPAGGGSLSANLENWRMANGHADVKAWLESGPVTFEAKGSLNLDPEHRPHGKLDATLTGFENALRQMQIDPALLSAGRALSGLLGSTSKLKLPVIFSEGIVRIGPLPTPVQISPLY